MTDVELKRYLHNVLRSKGYKNCVKRETYLYAEGNIPVMLVAHLDTVHSKPVVQINYNKNRISSPQGIGGDDRCGVIGIINILNRGYRPHILFTDLEEVGGIGARDFTNSEIVPDVNFILELDRKGRGEAVYYNCDNTEFEDFITDYGFRTEYGSFSDISIICPALGVAGVNLSAGYHNAHMLNEYVILDDLAYTVDNVCDILDNCGTYFEYVECEYLDYYHGSYDNSAHTLSECIDLCWALGIREPFKFLTEYRDLGYTYNEIFDMMFNGEIW